MTNNDHPRGVSIEQRSAATWRLAFFFLLAALVGGALVGGVIYATGQANSHQGVVNNTGNSSQDITTPGGETSIGITSPIPLTATYRQVVKEQLAQKSHLSIEEIRAEILNNATLYQILTQQNISSDQVVPTWLGALQTASDKLVQAGTWTSQQANTNMQFWREKSADSFDQKRVDGEISSWFVNGN